VSGAEAGTVTGAKAGTDEGAEDGLGLAFAGGKYSEPVWPQAAIFSTQEHRASDLTKICLEINMVKL
jgi:hypothetical protein